MRRIYYTEAYKVEFEATVTSVEQQGDRTVVMLDQTAFYPTSGGQPFDTGTINDVQVVEVVERVDGVIAHVLGGKIQPGQIAYGRINWARRFDHMQQHTGQHLLSAAIDRCHGARTSSFHLGSRTSTIDLDLELSTEMIAEAEAEANRVVWEDRDLSVRFVSDQDSDLRFRKKPARTGELRLIEIKDFDRSACGGTHVSRTGGVGIVAVSSWERFKGVTRLEFVCGGRALSAYRFQRDTLAKSVRVLSVLPANLADAIEKTQFEKNEQKRTIRALQRRLSNCEAAALIERAEKINGITSVIEIVQNGDHLWMKDVAVAVVKKNGFAVVLLSETVPNSVVIALSSDVAIDASRVLRDLISRFGGRGGGKPKLAQGGGLTGTMTEVLKTARELLIDLPD